MSSTTTNVLLSHEDHVSAAQDAWGSDGGHDRTAPHACWAGWPGPRRTSRPDAGAGTLGDASARAGPHAGWHPVRLTSRAHDQ
jgi:hypothetical protein